MAYATTALYSGLASVSARMPSLTGVLNGIPELPRAANARDYDGTLVAVAAERVVLDSVLREALPTTKSALGRLADSLVQARSALGLSEAVRARSDSLGRRIALALVVWSHADGFDSTRGRAYVPPKGPGLWINDTPASNYTTQNLSGASEFVALDNPANQKRAGNTSDRGLILSRPKSAAVTTLPSVNMAGTTEPYWGHLRPFVLRAWDECPAPEVSGYSTDTSSVLYRDARVVSDTKAKLTPEQRGIALFWADNAGESGTPVGHWISIASQMVSQRHLPAEEAARIMTLTAVAQADAFIAAWGVKFRDNLLRPRTYIRRLIDPKWEPLIPTPPFPEYPSAHSTQSAAARTVLTALLGDVAFDDSTSISIGHPVRHFATFRAASDEAGMSRIYAGIHFPSGNTGGRTLGECIGEKVIARAHVATRP
jgi:membrane-associated phospholipid phosphatase